MVLAGGAPRARHVAFVMMKRSCTAVAPSFAWDGVPSGGSSEEKGTRLAYEALLFNIHLRSIFLAFMMAPQRTGSRRAARAPRPTDVTGWCVGSEPQGCSRSRGCVHAPGAAEYCTLVGGANDDAEGSETASPGAEPERRFPCNEPGCGYRATQAGTLQSHKRTHSGERPYACDEPGCGFRAATASNLKTHKRTHSGERPYACDEPDCGYRAAVAGSLKKHKRTHSGERPYACDEPGCSYRAVETGRLTVHKRTHSYLKKHKRTHSGERPYACNEPGCAYRATTAGQLTKHKRTHSGERPYACDEPGCSYRAVETGRLTVHKRTHSYEPFVRHALESEEKRR
ncbi:hypothetical protein T492DRAFT_911768 [Pavlovales sp. CCMP2436]|nr:hypothetical protein T492DRAFT_911768 [Pavlovales sp. CCMP2436]